MGKHPLTCNTQLVTMRFLPVIFYTCGLAGLLVFRASAASPISIEDPQDSLIASAGARQSVSIRILIPENAGRPAHLKSRLRLYDVGLRLDSASSHDYAHEIPLPPSSGADAIRVPLEMTLPTPGLYRLDLLVNASDGSTLAESSVRLAAVLTRKENAPPPDDWGVCTHFAQGRGTVPRSLELIKLAGFARIRDEMYWNHIEKKPGEFVFPEWADAFIQAASARGLRPLIVLSYGNAQVYPAEFAGTKGFPESAEARALFVRYVREVVSRYKIQVRDWEVWNEPQGWGKVGPELYTPLLKEVYPAVKSIAPDATIISCGGGGAGGGPGGDFIRGIVSHGGLDYQDAFSIHPYMAPLNNPDTGYATYRSPSIPRVSIPVVWPFLKNWAQRNPRSDGKPLGLWVTEIGWFSSPLPSVKNPELAQAAWFARTYLLSRRHNAAKAVFWYDFQDDGDNPENKEHNFGLITTGYQPKPSYVTAATLSATLGNRPWHKAYVEHDSVKIFEYKGVSGGPGAVIAGWTVADESRTEAVQLPAGRYLLRDWRGQESPVVISGIGAWEWKLGPMPQYLVRQ